MAQTVTECLAAGTDSVNLIDGVKAGTWNVEGMTQTEINTMVQKNVDHLETILEYDGTNDMPNIKGAADSKKTNHVAAIATGKKYITDNS